MPPKGSKGRGRKKGKTNPPAPAQPAPTMQSLQAANDQLRQQLQSLQATVTARIAALDNPNVAIPSTSTVVETTQDQVLTRNARRGRKRSATVTTNELQNSVTDNQNDANIVNVISETDNQTRDENVEVDVENDIGEKSIDGHTPSDNATMLLCKISLQNCVAW